MKEIIEIRIDGRGGEDTVFKIGVAGVTEIKPATKNGQMAEITYYEIMRGENLYAEIHNWDVIIYR